MSTKDYQLAALIIARDSDKYGPWMHDFITMFTTFFAADNHRFSASKFRKACKSARLNLPGRGDGEEGK